MTRLVRRYDCGIAANPDDETQVAHAVHALLQTPERLEHMSRQARVLAKTYDRLSELRKFVAVIQSTVTTLSATELKAPGGSAVKTRACIPDESTIKPANGMATKSFS